jgi:hypothetical protein
MIKIYYSILKTMVFKNFILNQGLSDEVSQPRFMWEPKNDVLDGHTKLFPRRFCKMFRRFDISRLHTLVMPFDMIH